jgi:NADH-quinone oxidoreductase subunit E
MALTDVKTQSRLLAALYLAQEESGWLSPDAVERVSRNLGMSPGKVLSAASFYSMMKMEPCGEYLIQVCEGLSCYLVGGADSLIDHLSASLGISPGETSPDGRFTLKVVQCLAACGSAPALRVNDVLYENMSLEAIDELVARLKAGGS